MRSRKVMRKIASESAAIRSRKKGTSSGEESRRRRSQPQDTGPRSNGYCVGPSARPHVLVKLQQDMLGTERSCHMHRCEEKHALPREEIPKEVGNSHSPERPCSRCLSVHPLMHGPRDRRRCKCSHFLLSTAPVTLLTRLQPDAHVKTMSYASSFVKGALQILLPAGRAGLFSARVVDSSPVSCSQRVSHPPSDRVLVCLHPLKQQYMRLRLVHLVMLPSQTLRDA